MKIVVQIRGEKGMQSAATVRVLISEVLASGEA